MIRAPLVLALMTNMAAWYVVLTGDAFAGIVALCMIGSTIATSVSLLEFMRDVRRNRTIYMQIDKCD